MAAHLSIWGDQEEGTSFVVRGDARAPDLVLHLGILIRRLVVIFLVLVIIVLGRVLSSRLGEVDDSAPGAATAVDDVVEVDLVQAVLLIIIVVINCEVWLDVRCQIGGSHGWSYRARQSSAS